MPLDGYDYTVNGLSNFIIFNYLLRKCTFMRSTTQLIVIVSHDEVVVT